MKRVGVAELKSRLSHYLRVVRRGRSITVYDRDRPVARLVPVDGEELLHIRRRAPDAPRLADIPLLPSLELGVDVVDDLLDDRGRR